MTTFYETSYANIHRGVYDLAERSTEAYEARARDRARLRERRVGARDRLHAERHRGAQRRCLRLGPRQPRPRRPRARHRARAPLQLRPLAVHRRADRAPSSPSSRWTPRASSSSTTSTRSLARGRPKVLACTAVSNSLGTITPVQRLVEWAHAQGAIAVVDAAQAAPHTTVDVQAIGADFVAFTGAQALRADRDRRALGPRGAARGDVAVRARRPHDPQGHRREDDLERDPAQVRGRDGADRRGGRASPRRSTTSPRPGLPAIERHEHELTGLRARPSGRGPGRAPLRARPPTGASASSRSASRASIRTTSRRSSTPTASPSARGTTATSR